MTYNGWTNYETWNANLWISESSSDYWAERAQQIFNRSKSDEINDREANATYALSTAMETDFEENRPDLSHGPYLDMLLAAMSKVNWREIAERFIADTER